jgi:uncharacterized protein
MTRETTAIPDATRVASPCIDVCAIDEASGWCRGCLRTIDEIAGWSAMSDDGRRAVWRVLAQRRQIVGPEWRGSTQDTAR